MIGPDGIARRLPRVGVDARRDVDGEDGRTGRRPRGVVAAAKSRPVSTVDDEIAGREESPAAGDGLVGLQDAYPYAAPGQEARCHPAVGTVAALSDHNDDTAAVGASEQAQCSLSGRGAGARHQGLV